MVNHQFAKRNTPAAIAFRARFGWLVVFSICSGLFMEGLILTSSFAVVGHWGSYVVALSGSLREITWSFFICAALTIALSLSETQKYLNALLTVLISPLAVALTKAAQKGVEEALKLPPTVGNSHLLVLLLGRTSEYLVLNVTFLALTHNGHRSFWSFLTAGAVVGAVGGGAMVLLTVDPSALPFNSLVTVVDEIGWPIMCSLFVYGVTIARSP